MQNVGIAAIDIYNIRFQVRVYNLFKLNSVFLLVFAVFLTLTRNRVIVYFEAKQPTRVADKNIISSDLPSC